MCGYKSNYEPYTSQSLDMADERTSTEILYPLGSLYPHVVALQLQSDETMPWLKTRQYSGYHDTSFWAEISVPPSPSELSTKSTIRSRYSDSAACKVVSRIRRFLSRDELRRRQQQQHY
ncbi:hypothetical protein FE257_000418 [Aspergillus nanangensis]|uniref:Uncharacterized protein n=1 Tax=Aspergillus nanangensis TaxID=2582783 RepID=A0AAD4GWJ2_ASPNN|nr:hypothetical protein FE257_000418 [Aspergillus nanangensis]